MAFLLGCEKASVEFPTKRVLEDVSLGVNTGDRIGIVGRNGDGKSTLLKLLAGCMKADAGRVIRTRGVRVGMLGQVDALDDDHSIERAVVGDVPEHEWAASSRIRDIIAGLLGDIDWHGTVGTLSGGQRRRVDLARLLIGDDDVLMLDEPTNHLDIRAITWLAAHLKKRWREGEGALLVVTHDRWFLDEVCTSMWEVHDGRVDGFEGGFSAYVMQRVERDRQAQVAEAKRQNQLRRELAWLSRGARARATKPKFHVALARELIADVPELRDTIELKRMAMARLGKQVVDVEGVTVRYGDDAAGEGLAVLDDVTWLIGPGDRYGLVGGNGAGKTTLLKVVEGLIKPDAGRVKTGSTVRFAVLSQHLDSLKEVEGDRVREVVSRYSRRTMLDGKETTPGQLLEQLGFTSADLNEPVRDLSGGQKRRLALMLILLEEPNVLILDEPGNDLDIDMLAAVEDLLDGWPGTLLLVTHDRYLMERVTDDQFALIDGKLRHLPRGIDEYLELVAGRTTDRASSSSAGSASAGNGQSEGDVPSTDAAPKLSGGQLRELRKTMGSLEKKTATLRERIAATREKMAQVDPSDYEALVALQEEIAAYEATIEEHEMAWLEAAEALGE